MFCRSGKQTVTSVSIAKGGEWQKEKSMYKETESSVYRVCASRVCKMYDERSKLSDKVANTTTITTTTTTTTTITGVMLLSDTIPDAQFDVLWDNEYCNRPVLCILHIPAWHAFLHHNERMLLNLSNWS